MGQNNYKNIQENLSFATNTDMTEDQTREMMLKYLKIGLLKYWINSGLLDKLEVKIQKEDTTKTDNEIDSWNNWVFSIGANGWMNGSENNSRNSASIYLSAKQVKEKHKFYFRVSNRINNSMYKYGDTEITSKRESFYLASNYVLSINDHWSYGFFTGTSRSLFSNYKNSSNLFGGLEYDFFDYKESAKKKVTVATKIGAIYNKYYEKTVYEETEELLGQLTTSINGSVVKKWGSLNAGINYSAYLHDFDLNSFGINAGARIRIIKGLTFNINGDYSITHDQINIAAGDRSLEEVLLTQKELQSGYNFYFSTGLSYSFGSIYNTVVNPRFDGGGVTRYYFF
jgi:hypothetical protein